MGLFERLRPQAVPSDHRPVVHDAESRPLRHGEVPAHRGVELVDVVVRVHRNVVGVRSLRSGAGQLVVVGVPNGGHALALGGAGAVEFDVEAETLGGVGELHGCGDAHVLHIASDEVGRAVDHEVDAGLEAADVLGEEQRGDEQLAELAVGELRYASVGQRVLVPEVGGLVAGAPDLDRVSEGAEGIVGVGHEVDVRSDAVAEHEDRPGLAFRLAVLPAVDLEGGVAEFLALLGEVGHFLG